MSLHGTVISVNSSSTPATTLDDRLECARHQILLKRSFGFFDPNHRSIDVSDSIEYIRQFDIYKTPQEQIYLEEGGVVGDYHYFKPEIRKDAEGKFYSRRIAEVNLFTSEEYNVLNNKFLSSLSPGKLGENITTRDIDLDNLSEGTVLEIGTAKIKILCRRSFCFKFINAVVPDPKSWGKTLKQKFDLGKVGVVGQVIEPGIVKPGDTIIAQLPDTFKPLTHFPGNKKYIKIKLDDAE